MWCVGGGGVWGGFDLFIHSFMLMKSYKVGVSFVSLSVCMLYCGVSFASLSVCILYCGVSFVLLSKLYALLCV